MKPESKLSSIAATPVYPILLPAYAILSLLAYNLGEIRPEAALRSLMLAVGFALVSMWALKTYLRDLHKAAFVSGAFSFLFFTYGHIRLASAGAAWSRATVLVPVWIVLFALTFFIVYRSRWSFSGVSLVLNGIWLIAVGLTLYQMVTYEARILRGMEAAGASLGPVKTAVAEGSDALPDIYYFILDSYARADTLQDAYGYDNSEFLDSLEALGFFIGSCSQSNYDRTELSLASSLNMEYIQALHPELTGANRDKLPLWALIQHSRVRKILEDNGYTTVTFATGFTWSELRDADQFIEPDLPFGVLSEFEVLVLRTTFMKGLQELGLVHYQAQEFERYLERTQLILERLPELSAQAGPQFYFVHILEPHPPFVFNPDGTPADGGSYLNDLGKYTPETYARGYLSELQFINHAVLDLVRGLIDDASIPPVIIIQGDHGPWFQSSRYTMPNLNAYYLPGHADQLYPAVTPVNSFRIVFNAYLGTDYPLYEDRSYDSPDTEPYNYALVPNQCPPKVPEG